jgi:hypothetical protein
VNILCKILLKLTIEALSDGKCISKSIKEETQSANDLFSNQRKDLDRVTLQERQGFVFLAISSFFVTYNLHENL